MKIDLIKKIESSFLSCEKDAELIIKELFVKYKPHADILKALLVVNTPDCLDNIEKYKEVIDKMDVATLIKHGYVRFNPKIRLPEHEEVKSYILISFDNFTQSGNDQFRDCVVSFDIICHSDYWDLGDYRTRPLKIAGYIDGLLDDIKLTGIGTFQFLGCNELILSEELAGYTLSFMAVHGSDDRIPGGDM